MNATNLKKVKLGMSTSSVVDIMGEPIEVVYWAIDSGNYRFVYTPPVMYSDNLYVLFSLNDSKVVKILDGGKN